METERKMYRDVSISQVSSFDSASISHRTVRVLTQLNRVRSTRLWDGGFLPDLTSWVWFSGRTLLGSAAIMVLTGCGARNVFNQALERGQERSAPKWFWVITVARGSETW